MTETNINIHQLHARDEPEHVDHARRVRWWSAYTSVLNGRHLAGDPVAVAHATACAAAEIAAGPMPDEFKVAP